MSNTTKAKTHLPSTPTKRAKALRKIYANNGAFGNLKDEKFNELAKGTKGAR